MVKNVLIGFLLLLSFGFLGTVQAEELNWKPMGILDSDIVFYGEVFDLNFIKAQKAQTSNYRKEYQYQVWEGSAGEYGEVLSAELIEPGYRWTRLIPFEKSFAGGFWNKWKNKNITWLDKGEKVSVLGRNKYQMFNSGSDECFTWRVVFNSGGFTRRDDTYVTGYYCQKDEIEGKKLTSIIKNVGFKKARVPSIPKIVSDKRSLKTKVGESVEGLASRPEKSSKQSQPPWDTQQDTR